MAFLGVNFIVGVLTVVSRRGIEAARAA